MMVTRPHLVLLQEHGLRALEYTNAEVALPTLIHINERGKNPVFVGGVCFDEPR